MLYYERTPEQISQFMSKFLGTETWLFLLTCLIVIVFIIKYFTIEIDSWPKAIGFIILAISTIGVLCWGGKILKVPEPKEDYIRYSLTATPSEAIISYGEYNGSFYDAQQDVLRRHPDYETSNKGPYCLYDVKPGEKEWNEVRELRTKYCNITVFIMHLNENTKEINPWQDRTAKEY